MFQGRKEHGVVVVRITFPFDGQQYTTGQVWPSSQIRSRMQDGVTVVAQSNVLSDVMLATCASDEVVNLQPATSVGLWPPTGPAAPMEFQPLAKVSLLLLVHCENVAVNAGTRNR